MNIATRRIATAAVTLGLATASVVAAPSAAEATPADPYQHSAAVSRTEYKALKMVARIKRDTSHRTLDYRAARAEFGAKVDWRRQFAAGWKVGGGKIAHVSKAELRQIEKVRRKSQPGAVPRVETWACTGQSKHIVHQTGDFWNEYYYDSCETNLLLRNFGWCVGGAGLIAAIVGHPSVTAIMAVSIASCGGVSGWISTAQANSDLNAVVVKNGDIVKYEPVNPTPQNPVRYQVPVRIVPQ